MHKTELDEESVAYAPLGATRHKSSKSLEIISTPLTTSTSSMNLENRLAFIIMSAFKQINFAQLLLLYIKYYTG